MAVSLSLPSIIGSFQIERLLGMGATAQVYPARDLSTDSQVALKVLHPHLSDPPAFETRFEREARAARDPDHPGIARVLNFGLEVDMLTWRWIMCLVHRSKPTSKNVTTSRWALKRLLALRLPWGLQALSLHHPST